MDYGLVYEGGGNCTISSVENCALDNILDSGQCFRWNKLDDYTYEGIAMSRHLKISHRDGSLTFFGTTLDEYESVWHDYFDLSTDYGQIKTRLSSDPVMRKAMAFAPGIRILRQEPWEALCSFIFSQNNNIPRIKGLVERFCENFGQKINHGRIFPTPEAVAALTVDDLAPVRAGFRAKYIIDAAKKVASGEIDLAALRTASIDEAKKKLITIHGVGPKVADCALLYGLGRMDCVPIDVWMNRVLTILYPDGFPREFNDISGIAQQYLFHYARKCDEALVPQP